MSDPTENTFAATGEPSPAFIQTVRQLQIVVGAMAMGVLTIGFIFMFVNDVEMGDPGVVSMVGAGFAVIAFIAHAVVPPIALKSEAVKVQRDEFAKQTENEQLVKALELHRGPIIIGTALLEGAAVVNLIVFLIEHWIGNLVIAGVFMVLILLRIPSVYGSFNKASDLVQQINSGQT